MKKRKPYKQRWKNSRVPSRNEIIEGRNGFDRLGLLISLNNILDETELFGLTVGPRSIRANTVPRCYLFIDERSFDMGYENIACIDVIEQHCRLIIRPFGKGENRFLILPNKYRNNFEISDLPDWLELRITNNQRRRIAIDVLNFIKDQYILNFDI